MNQTNKITIIPALTQLKSKMGSSDDLTKHTFKVIFVPNPWGLPICNPPLTVIDDSFTKESLDDWLPKMNEEIERCW